MWLERGKVLAALVLLFAFIIASCGDGPSEPETPVATSVTISPNGLLLDSIGSTVQLSGSVYDQNGGRMSGTAVTWNSSVPSVAAVNSTGLVTAVNTGSSSITATAGTAFAAVSVTVDCGPANVIMESANLSKGYPGEIITLSLRNTGNAGSFKVEAWGLPTTPNGPSTFYGASSPANVAAGWQQTLEYEVTTGLSAESYFVKWVLVFTRDDQNVVWRQTGRWDF